MENAQIRHLVEHFELARESRLAQAIVDYTNRVLDEEERRRQVVRVRPGELPLHTRRGPLILPLRTPEDIRRVMAGERWDLVRRDILQHCAERYRNLFPEASADTVARFLRCLWPGYAPRGRTASPLHGPRQQRPWGTAEGVPLAQLDTSRASRRLEKDPPRPGHRPETFAKLAHFLGSEAGIPPAFQEPMILDLMALRARFCPRVGTLATGQMPFERPCTLRRAATWDNPAATNRWLQWWLVCWLAVRATHYATAPQPVMRGSWPFMAGAWLGY